jgi:hypothetical protein
MRLLPVPLLAIQPAWEPNSAWSDASGRFRLRDIAPGKYVLDNAASPWVLRSASLGGRNVLNVPTEFSAGAAYRDLVLTYADRVASATPASTLR